MARNIKGIIVEIGGDTSGLQNALKKVNSTISSLSGELRDINKLLKFDPKNTDLLNQKQTVLKQNIAETSSKLKGLKDMQQRYIEEGGDLNSPEYRALQKEIIETEQKLKQLKVEASNWTQISRKLQSLSDGFKKVGSAVQSAGKKLSALSAALGAVGFKGVKYNAELEKYKTAITTLTGSEKKAAKIMDQIQKDAAKTPFDVRGLTQANQLLLSTGLNGKDSRKAVLALGNAISATGGGDDELARMAVNLQQIKNVGKASALDIKQFAYAGIDVYGLLADYLGTTKEEASKLKPTYEQLVGALEQASKKGGKYYNAMEKQSQTLNGKVSNLKDSFNTLTGNLTKTFLPTIQKILDKLITLSEKFNSLNPKTQEMIAKILLIVASLGPALIIIGKLISSIGGILGVLSKLSSWIATITASSGTLSGVIGALAGPIGIVIAAVLSLAGVFVYLYKTNEEFRKKAQNTWNNIVNLFKKDVIPLFESVKTLVISLSKSIIDTFKLMWTYIEPIFNTMLSWLMDYWNNTLQYIVKDILGFVKEAIILFNAIWNKAISPLINMLIKILAPAFTTVFLAVWKVISTFYTNMTKVIGSIISRYKGLIMFISGVFTGDWKKAWSGIKLYFVSIWNGIKNALKTIWDAIKGIISLAIQLIKTNITTKFNLIKSFLSKIWSTIKTNISNSVSNIKRSIVSNFQTAYNTIKNLFNKLPSFFGVIWSKIKNTFSNLGTKIGSAISGAVKAGINGVLSQVERVVNRAISSINGAIGTINKIPGVNISNLQSINVLKLAKGGIVDKATLAMIGEGKSAEAVIPLDRTLTKYLSEALKQTNYAGNITMNFYPQHMTEAELDNAFRYLDRRFGIVF